MSNRFDSNGVVARSSTEHKGAEGGRGLAWSTGIINNSNRFLICVGANGVFDQKAQGGGGKAPVERAGVERGWLTPYLHILCYSIYTLIPRHLHMKPKRDCSNCTHVLGEGGLLLIGAGLFSQQRKGEMLCCAMSRHSGPLHPSPTPAPPPVSSSRKSVIGGARYQRLQLEL